MNNQPLTDDMNLPPAPMSMSSEMRKIMDCRQIPSESQCQLTISGPEEDVLDAAMEHAIANHGHQDTPEFREQLRTMLRDVE